MTLSTIGIDDTGCYCYTHDVIVATIDDNHRIMIDWLIYVDDDLVDTV